jgi:vacuolar iron transporter family protein
VNDVDYLGYVPADAFPTEADRYRGYADDGGTRSADRYRDAGQPPGGPPRRYGSPLRPPANGPRAAGYPPPDSRLARGYPPGNGPMPPYPPRNGRPASWSPLPGSVPLSAYPPDAGPGPVYRPQTGGPAPQYPPFHDGDDLLGEHRMVREHSRATSAELLFRSLLDDGLREHRDVSGGWLRPAVFGAMDGLVTNSSLIAGIGGGGGGHGMIVLTGIAGLIAGAFSMATGEYISVTSQNELTQAEVELEREQHRRDPMGKLRRLTEIFIDKGVSPNLAEAVVRQISAEPERAVETHVREELGIDPADLPSPQTAAAASFAAFTVGALIPLSPFLLGFSSLNASLAAAGLAAVAGGAAVAKLTGRSMLTGGLRQFAAAFLATGMAFVVGHLISGAVA